MRKINKYFVLAIDIISIASFIFMIVITMTKSHVITYNGRDQYFIDEDVSPLLIILSIPFQTMFYCRTVYLFITHFPNLSSKIGAMYSRRPIAFNIIAAMIIILLIYFVKKF